MATTEPQKWAATLGSTADVNAIPATTPSGSGRASFSGLFPPVTQLPLDQGGIAPERGDFNALFKYLGEYLFYLMQGGMFSYSTDYDYTAGNFATPRAILCYMVDRSTFASRQTVRGPRSNTRLIQPTGASLRLRASSRP